MYSRLAAVLRPADPADRDAGLSIVEMVVAFMVFALVTVGGVVALATSLTLTSDNRAREVGANLAAQEVDAVRSAADVFKVLDARTTTALNGTSYTVDRTVSWVSTTGLDSRCGAAGGALLYKRVNVAVTWPGMRASTSPVRADTVLAPNSKINDPEYGTILVSVTSITGAGGTAGVTVTVTPSDVAGNSAVGLTTQPAATDAQGCSYALKVAPGTYDVTISRTDAAYRDEKQAAASTKVVGVAVGGSASADFTYDRAGQFPMSYADGFTGARLLPADLAVSFLSTYPQYDAVGTDATRDLSPTSSGYQAIAGPYAPASAGAKSCLSVDPQAWPTAGDGAVGLRAAAAAAAPGTRSSTPLGVPMGVVQVKLAENVAYVRARVSSPVDDDPGCRAGLSYTFNVQSANKKATGNVVNLALPFGSWTFTTGTSAGNVSTPVPYTALAPQTRGRSYFDLTLSFNAVLLDPRRAP